MPNLPQVFMQFASASWPHFVTVLVLALLMAGARRMKSWNDLWRLLTLSVALLIPAFGARVLYQCSSGAVGGERTPVLSREEPADALRHQAIKETWHE